MQLKVALQTLVPIKEQLKNSSEKTLNNIGKQIDICATISEKLEKQLHPNPPVLLNKGNVINTGVNAELDDLRNIANSGKRNQKNRNSIFKNIF